MSAPWTATTLRRYCDVCGALVTHGTLGELAPRMDARTLWALSHVVDVVGSEVDCWWCPMCSNAGAFGPVEFGDGAAAAARGVATDPDPLA